MIQNSKISNFYLNLFVIQISIAVRNCYRTQGTNGFVNICIYGISGVSGFVSGGADQEKMSNYCWIIYWRN